MFVKETSTIDIIIFYKKIKNHYVAYSKNDFENEDLTEEQRSSYKKVTIQMKQLTWGLYNDLQEGAVDVDSEGNRKFNYKKYKELRLVKLISGWDATSKDDEGNDIPVKATEKSIKCLAPEVAETILNSYDQVMYLTEEEEKK